MGGSFVLGPNNFHLLKKCLFYFPPLVRKGIYHCANISFFAGGKTSKWKQVVLVSFWFPFGFLLVSFWFPFGFLLHQKAVLGPSNYQYRKFIPEFWRVQLQKELGDPYEAIRIPWLAFTNLRQAVGMPSRGGQIRRAEWVMTPESTNQFMNRAVIYWIWWLESDHFWRGTSPSNVDIC